MISECNYYCTVTFIMQTLIWVTIIHWKTNTHMKKHIKWQFIETLLDRKRHCCVVAFTATCFNFRKLLSPQIYSHYINCLGSEPFSGHLSHSHMISCVVGSVYNSAFATTPYLYVWYHDEDMKRDSSLEYPAKEEQSEDEINTYSLILAPHWCQPAGYSHLLQCRSYADLFS